MTAAECWTDFSSTIQILPTKIADVDLFVLLLGETSRSTNPLSWALICVKAMRHDSLRSPLYRNNESKYAYLRRRVEFTPTVRT